MCTTLADGQPQTALESLACGTPLIAFNIGPMPSLAIEGETGKLVFDSTSSALKDEIIRFFENSDQHPGLNENCRREALEKYNLSKQTKEYIYLYESILADDI